MAVIVIGAGIAGLACTRALAAAGVAARVLERGHVPGGRLASRRFHGRPADIGAAYFTVGDAGFAAVVEQWRRDGLARPWTDTLFAYGPDGRRPTTGPVRWAAPGGLRSLAERLADGLDVTTGHTVGAVAPGPYVDGEPADAVVLAMPGPQARRLLHPDLRGAVAAAAAQQWEPVLAAVLRYPHRAWADFAGAFVNDHPLLATVCDDGDRRGDRAPVLVAHSTAAFARAHLDRPADAAAGLADAVGRLLDLPEPAVDTHVHRWTYARPRPGHGPAFHLDDDRVALAGDAFGEPRVQTAWRSGHDAGVALAARLTG